jgi:YVTN family beta-propeller protein
MRYSIPVLFLLGLAIAACGGGESGDGGVADTGLKDAGLDGGLKECLYKPLEVSFEKTHKVKDGVGIVPSGRAITPEGTQLQVGLFPGNMAMTPDGKTIIISNNGYGEDNLVVVDTAAGTVRQTVSTPGNWLFYGLAVSPDGKKLYAAGGPAKVVYVYSIGDTGLLTYSSSLGEDHESLPTGLTLSKDGKKLYVTSYTSDSVSMYDADTGDFIKTNKAGKYAFDVALSSDESKLYVSDWGQVIFSDPTTVRVVKADDLSYVTEIAVGKNPEKILEDPSKNRLYVLNSDQETISIIDTITDTVVSTISLLSSSDTPTGVFPLGAALTQDGSTLYVAAAAKNSVEVVDTATLKVKGSIPAGWYPVAVEISKDGKKLFVLNAKGEGSGANDDKVYIADKMTGTLSIMDVPSAAQLADMTSKVAANNLRPLQYYPQEQCAGEAFPVPFAAGGKSPIEHVIFIVKENRTFDQVFGDFPGADADPSLVLFGEDITPNHYKLAREFTLLDNFYAESEISIQGHLWTTGMETNDYSERTWIMTYRGSSGSVLPLSGVEPASSPLNPYIFERLSKEKVTFVDYGEVVGMLNQPEEIFKHWDQSYPGIFFTQAVTDKSRAEYFAKRIGEGYLPKFTYMLLPNDHTEGTKAGRPSPESHVADNDEGLGIVVEALSKSKFWESSMIFVTEDDPQDGYDHVDAHRTLALVISPWTKKGYISNVHYSFSSFFATFERILDVEPLNTYDANASPLFDCFTNIPDTSVYTHIPRKVPATVNTKNTPFAAESEGMDFTVPDNAPGLQKVLWHYMKGEKPYPGGIDND